MMNYAMALDYQNCINCKACETACKEENGVQLGANKQRIWVGIVEGSIFDKSFINLYPSQCNHCETAPCVSVCPTNASYVGAGGIVQVDYKKCILCKGCMEACPYDARFVDDTKVAVDKCTFCDHRIEEYGTTACQTTCPTNVRMFGDLDDDNSDLVKLLKKKRFFFLKEKSNTRPKLFYIVPDSENYARQSISHETKIYTWDEYLEKYRGIRG
ncbi:4Fe-4S dicluster domain-containing protein [Malaciobacter halophilus]|uniref:Molybdopterin oxidoreductase n=2 Tax=Malaciobacter marinus TaxID=505249 RepID=A0ABX4LVA3_9BACT|nr:molybdopterin oxidoreductase [Malaciobacter marinus]PHO14583.1 molybdopterin oxidoreductase [Malaciobacter marinus]RYA23237.1 4Fe-4S dicluster domain-containing protein [Malaciobacter halophilus]